MSAVISNKGQQETDLTLQGAYCVLQLDFCLQLVHERLMTTRVDRKRQKTNFSNKIISVIVIIIV